MANSSEKIVARSSDERPKELDAMKEEVISVGHPTEAVGQSRSFGSERDPPIYLPNLHVSDTHIGHNKGYEIFPGEWDDFSLYGYTEELNSKSPGIYNHNATIGFHNGYGSENSPGNPGRVGFQDRQWVCEGSRSSGLWSDRPKPLDIHHPLSLAPHQPRSFYDFSSRSVPYKDRTHSHGVNQVGIPGNAGYKFGTNVGPWHVLNHGRHFGLGNGSFCSCCSANDSLNEHNRGPRSSKSKIHMFTDSYSFVDNNRNAVSPGKIHNASYFNPDLFVQYEDARFFVIKSYNEDNIHKSIKYGVWASTPNGNQKLNTAYHEANEKLNSCPIFLLFSVNASSQFCGVAEMVGPVDFEKSVDYWQQDKWSGQFPVKWHIIKDVPNSQFRHIVLENNDNKPVTNSRDTQEVKLEQGVEMLNIFKNYDTNISILDDFDYYEDRQKSLQERKSREHNSFPVTGQINAVGEPNELITKMSKSFAQVVRLK